MDLYSSRVSKLGFQQLAAQIEGHQIKGVGEKFGRPTKMTAHLLFLLEIDF